MVRQVGPDELKTRFRAASPGILPSLLACDFAHLEREIRAVEAAGVPALHLDIMDGHFVPNLSMGVPIVEAVRRTTELPLDVHLMISEPARYIEPFRKAGADSLTIHIEAAKDPRPVLERIREMGALAGLALNPATPLDAIESALPHCDLVLVMSVTPGFGGQKFESEALDKLRALSGRKDCSALLEVDGGVDLTTVGPCATAGAHLFVAGTAVFRQPDYTDVISRMRSLAVSSTAAN